MKKSIISLVICSISFVAFQEISPKESLKTMVETEKSFAQMAKDKSVKEAFLQYLAPEAVVFDKGQAVNALSHWQNTSFQEQLTWQPNRAGIAVSGELGYTAGNWQSYNQEKQTATGSFVTLWKKIDKNWKVLADIGVAHPAGVTNMPLQERYNAYKPDVTKNLKNQAEKFVFMKDHFYWKNAKTSPNAFEANLSEQAVLFRNNTKPLEGKKASVAYLTKNYDTKWIYTGLKVVVSEAGDLACIYGMISGKDAKGKSIVGSYLRMWQQEAKNEWRITVDIETVE